MTEVTLPDTPPVRAHFVSAGYDKLFGRLTTLAAILDGQNRPASSATCREAIDTITLLEHIRGALSDQVLALTKERDELMAEILKMKDPPVAAGRLWTWDKVELMAKMRRQGDTLAKIGDRFNITRSHVRLLLTRHEKETRQK